MSAITALKARSKPLTKSPIEVITPKLAEEWLQTMVANRPKSDALIYELATAMQDNKWVLNGETIKFNDKGQLFDGQHRLWASIISGRSFRTYVVRGIEDTRAFSTVDVGKLRTHGDIFAMSGYTDYNLASGVAIFLYYYKNDMLTLRGPRTQRSVKNAKLSNDLRSRMLKESMNVRTRGDVDKETVVRFAEPIKEKIIASIRAIKHQKARKLIPIGILAACHYLFAEKSKVDADEFVEFLTDGVGLLSTDPIWVLRERLIANQAMRGRTGMKLNRWVQAAFVIKSWNKRRSGEKVQTLRLQENEDFPKVK